MNVGIFLSIFKNFYGMYSKIDVIFIKFWEFKWLNKLKINIFFINLWGFMIDLILVDYNYYFMIFNEWFFIIFI